MMRLGRRASLWVWCYTMLLPVLAIYAYVRIIPIGRSVQLSFYDWKLIARVRPFVGLANYRSDARRRELPLAMRNTTVYSVATVGVQHGSGVAARRVPGARGRLSVFYQTIYFLPVITPMVPMAIAWKWIYDYNYGLLNYALSWSAFRRRRGSPIRRSRYGR